MSNLAIQIENLGKVFKQGRKEIEALKGINLTVAQGEVFGFVGANGAGKSTTIKILLGLLPNYTGSVLLNGLPVSNPQARHRLGYVAEVPRLPDMLSPKELLQTALALHNYKSADVKQRSDEWLKKLNIAEYANRKVSTLSKGNQQRTSLALAMSIQPNLLVLDEPLSGLDPIGRKEVVDLLSEYKKEGGTIFFTSHVLHDVERIADHFGLIHHGIISTIQSPHKLLSHEQQFTIRYIGHAKIANAKQESTEIWSIEISQNKLWQIIEKIKSINAHLLEVRPSMSLEQTFFDYIKK